MSKTTMANKLPRKLELKMQTVGEQIRLARLRRNLSVAQVAERASCSHMTIASVRCQIKVHNCKYSYLL